PGGGGPLRLADHGGIGALRSAARAGLDGTIDWYCPVRFDAPSVFASILDADRGGHFRIAPREPYTTKQLYFPDTNVLITRFFSAAGVAEVQDFMPVGGAQQLVRRVMCVRGTIDFRLECEPRFDYGRAAHETALSAGGAHFRSPDLSLALGAPVPLTRTLRGVMCDFTLAAGESASFTLSESDVAPLAAPTEAG